MLTRLGNPILSILRSLCQFTRPVHTLHPAESPAVSIKPTQKDSEVQTLPIILETCQRCVESSQQVKTANADAHRSAGEIQTWERKAAALEEELRSLVALKTARQKQEHNVHITRAVVQCPGDKGTCSCCSKAAARSAEMSTNLERVKEDFEAAKQQLASVRKDNETLREEGSSLRAQAAERGNRAIQYKNELGELQIRYGSMVQEDKVKTTELSELRAKTKQDEHRIRQVSDDLERAKEEALKYQEQMQVQRRNRDSLEEKMQRLQVKVTEQATLLKVQEAANTALDRRYRRLSFASFLRCNVRVAVTPRLIDAMPPGSMDKNNSYTISADAEIPQISLFATPPSNAQSPMRFDYVFTETDCDDEVTCFTNSLVNNTILERGSSRNGVIIATGFSGTGKSTTVRAIAAAAGELILEDGSYQGRSHYLVLAFFQFDATTLKAQEAIAPPTAGFPADLEIVVENEKTTKERPTAYMYTVRTTAALRAVLDHAEASRKTEPTLLNKTSSRSHMKLELIAKGRYVSGSMLPPCLDIFDLAGGEPIEGTSSKNQTHGINLSRTAIQPLLEQFRRCQKLEDSSGYKVIRVKYSARRT